MIEIRNAAGQVVVSRYTPLYTLWFARHTDPGTTIFTDDMPNNRLVFIRDGTIRSADLGKITTTFGTVVSIYVVTPNPRLEMANVPRLQTFSETGDLLFDSASVPLKVQSVWTLPAMGAHDTPLSYPGANSSPPSTGVYIDGLTAPWHATTIDSSVVRAWNGQEWWYKEEMTAGINSLSTVYTLESGPSPSSRANGWYVGSPRTKQVLIADAINIPTFFPV